MDRADTAAILVLHRVLVPLACVSFVLWLESSSLFQFVMKVLCFKLLPAIKLSYKLSLCGYSTIGFSASYVAPVVFDINIG